MGATRSTPSRPSSPPCADPRRRGFTLVELLVSMAVASVVMATALTITLATRNGFSADQNRTGVNQNLRSALDLIGIELRQAGERLPFDVPALEIANGISGSDRLILRRNLLGEVLPLCEPLGKGSVTDRVRVADNGGSPPKGCAPLADGDGDGYGDNIDAWRDYRAGMGGSVPAFVFNPVDRQGEFFTYRGDLPDPTYLRKDNIDSWKRDYGMNQECRVYLLEQRSFDVHDGVLRFKLNGGDGGTIHLATNIDDLELKAFFRDGTASDTLTSDDEWTSLKAIEVTLTGRDTIDHETVTRTVSARFFPRNILSN